MGTCPVKPHPSDAQLTAFRLHATVYYNIDILNSGHTYGTTKANQKVFAPVFFQPQ
jgi:hypothetical protein